MMDSQKKVIVFANTAGSARNEKNDPKALGRFLKEYINGKLIAIGVSEVVISVNENHKNNIQTVAYEPLVNIDEFKTHRSHVNDLKEFAFPFQNAKKLFLAHLDSEFHNSKEAIQNKWHGPKASPRFRQEKKLKRRIFQGTGALVFSDYQECEGVLLRPAGTDPNSNPKNSPNNFLGHRSSEPRSAIIIRQLTIADQLKITLAICQLETNKDDLRIGTKKEINNRKGSKHRIEQIKKLMEHLPKTGPVVIIGDFNARPGSKELNYLCSKFGYRQVLPDGTPQNKNKSSKWAKNHLFNKGQFYPPRFSKSEKEQGWPYSHLKHEILIDHAFVKGFDLIKWGIKCEVIQLPNETKGLRYTDHRPIALSFIQK